jgi:hypothetical protein
MFNFLPGQAISANAKGWPHYLFICLIMADSRWFFGLLAGGASVTFEKQI